MSAFSTWEKELHKIVFDPRYLLLTSKERKQVFEQYVKERAEEERREKRNKLKERKEQFRQLLEEAHLTSKYDLFSLTALCICSVVIETPLQNLHTTCLQFIQIQIQLFMWHMLYTPYFVCTRVVA